MTASGTSIFVQARMGSTRLRGKSLMQVWRDYTVVGMLLARLKRCARVDRIVVAMPDSAVDDPLEAACARMGISVFRGSEADVLGRFAEALSRYPAQAVVRVCADNPLIDPAQIDRLVEFRQEGGFDYAYNHRPECGLPDGLGAEVVTADALRRLAAEASEPAEREHVILRLLRKPESVRTGVLRAEPALTRPDYRLDVDYPADLKFVRRLCFELPPTSGPFWNAAEIIRVLDAQPELLALRQKRPAA